MLWPYLRVALRSFHALRMAASCSGVLLACRISALRKVQRRLMSCICPGVLAAWRSLRTSGKRPVPGGMPLPLLTVSGCLSHHVSCGTACRDCSGIGARISIFGMRCHRLLWPRSWQAPFQSATALRVAKCDLTG